MRLVAHTYLEPTPRKQPALPPPLSYQSSLVFVAEIHRTAAEIGPPCTAVPREDVALWANATGPFL